jgi:hypothetical protein
MYLLKIATMSFALFAPLILAQEDQDVGVCTPISSNPFFLKRP